MVFYWAARVLDAWLASWRALVYPQRAPRLLRDVWRQLPGDAIGFIVMRGCGITAPSRVIPEPETRAVLVEDPRVARWFRLSLIPIQAQTLGHFVLAREPISEATLEHELEHVRQWSRFGPFYLPLYVGSSAVALARGRRPYWDNRFEAAARDRSALVMSERSNQTKTRRNRRG